MNPLKWPRRVVVVRHGQSTQNVALDLLEPCLDDILLEMKSVRDADIPLTDVGLWQASETGLYLASHHRFDVCFSSPYVRTMQTAEGIVSHLGYSLSVFKDDRLREKEFGRLHGHTSAEINQKYPDEFSDRERDGKYLYRLPRGENYPDVGMRVHSFFDKLHRNYNGQNVLVVTHTVPYLMTRAMFEHLDEEDVLALGTVPNCGLAEYVNDTSEHAEGRMKLKTWNLTAYPENDDQLMKF